MDLIFQPTRGRSFSIEIGYFDTVLEIKEKIQKHQGIPISKQSLIFNGDVLNDELNVHSSEILDRSCIQLVVASDPEKLNTNNTCATNNVVKLEHEFSLSPSSKKIQLLVKMPASKLGVAVEMDVNDSIRRLKEKIHEMEGIPVGRLIIHAGAGGVELQDHRSLVECELFDHSEIDVSIRPSSSTTSSGSSVGNSSGSKKMKIMVLTKCGTRKIPVEVSPSDNVGQLRNELQKLNHNLDLNLPQEGYFFIYKQNVMDDDRSFRWHHVVQGDTIEIFNGSISGGL
ncbi:ubiquitin domain-containing protein 7SL RNA1-like [Coffea eugenioides]|uniref:Ubiquitin domain-containing protein 7SL RNA1-like n=1 Tax=Coffea arabica TaxID=13443 RepID=A0A6P6TKE7_COFAR|nr:ubiquitin domain-containing protein 7SL RNA1-like [Coffea arabica]XP_027078001.1 ubiquitin domain-containing protein 7SL RNA1-like [Coffea arabica]XP_027178244.1 ubiquitin domain-containing protein 7SL RNA1-like [Coffea eugenioides]